MATQSGQINHSPQQNKSTTGQKPTSTRGFAAMDAEKHRKVSAQGGRASQIQQHENRQSFQTKQSQPTAENSSKKKQESITESISDNESIKPNTSDN